MTETRTIALVTGATRGLGRETAKRLAALGYHVAASGRDLAATRSLVADLQKAGHQASAFCIDLAEPATFTAAAAELAERFGRLDVLVNNAGIQLEGGWLVNTAATVEMSKLRQTFEINLFGLVELTHALLPLLKKSRAANIVNISSILGSLTMQADPKSPIAAAKPFAYNASKAALNAFTVHLAASLREDGIQVNSAHPGWVRTDLGTQQAPMSIDEGVETIVKLATLPPGSQTGRFIHRGEELPW